MSFISRFRGSKHPTTWYKCPYCDAVFDVPAAKPSCPRCGTRCNWTNEIAPVSPLKPEYEIPELGRIAQRTERGSAKPEVGGSNPPPVAISRRKFLKFAAAGVIAAPIVKHFLPPENGWLGDDVHLYGFSTDDFRYKATERYSTGITDWRGVYGTAGDGVALISRAHPVDPRFVSDVEWFLKPESLEIIEISCEVP